MYKTLALCLTKKFIKLNLVPAEKEPVYSYGFEIILSMIVYALIFVITAIITSTLVTSLVLSTASPTTTFVSSINSTTSAFL